jgi:imidazolonepropionase-like amidohydrolase
MAINAGVNTIEHGYYATPALFQLMVDKGTIFVPTLGIAERLAPNYAQLAAQTKLAFDMGVRLACGADTGTFPHGFVGPTLVRTGRKLD